MGSNSKSSSRKRRHRSRSASHEEERRHKHHRRHHKDRKNDHSNDDSIANASPKESRTHTRRKSRSASHEEERKHKHHRRHHKERKREHSRNDSQKVGQNSASKEPRTDRESSKKRNRSLSNEDDSQKRHEHEQNKTDEKSSKRNNKEPESSNRFSEETSQVKANIDPPALVTENQEPSNGFSASLSIEETNKLRAKLGMKPLQTNSTDSKKVVEEDDGKKKDDLGEFYHKPAENTRKKLEEEKLRVKLSQRRTKCSFDKKLSQIVLLGAENSENDEDVEAWITKSRKIENTKEEAEKRAKVLEEMDEQLETNVIVKKRNRKYAEDDIKGLQVDHNINSFKEGETVILTLEDKEVLDDSEDILINTNMLEDEQTKKNNENKKMMSFYSNYSYDDEDLSSELCDKPLLSKYDEEKKQQGYKIGIDNVAVQKPTQLDSVKYKLLHNLNTSNLKIASDYYNEEELTKFKKSKKKVRKVRTKPKLFSEENEEEIKREDELDFDDYSNDVLDIKVNLKMEEDEDLKKIKKVREKSDVPSVEDFKNVEKCEFTGLVFNSLEEFCKNSVNEPHYENCMNQRKNVECSEEVQMEVEDDSNWKQVNYSNPPIKEIASSFENLAPILEEEPDARLGVAAVLKLAKSKGYLDKETAPQLTNSRLAHLQAQNYLIEDKNYGNGKSERGNRRDYLVQDFDEKESYEPNVKLEYFDDQGNVLDSKEAFRYMSHRFHGVAPGKNKIEKRLKKSLQEGLIRKMNSMDTPLGTLSMLQAKQKETQSPYIVLSGKSHTLSKK